jgi:putative alpha-1,2-mannosidase
MTYIHTKPFTIMKTPYFKQPLYLTLFLLYAGTQACNINNNQKRNPATQDLTQYVDPFIGSDAHGHVFVGANVPFGMIQAGPANFFKGWDWSSSYHFTDSILKGFIHLNLSGTGGTDLENYL